MESKIWSAGRLVKGISLAFSLVVLSATVSLAQGPDDPGGGGTVGNETGVPIDGGISALLVAGVAYGAKKLHKGRKQQEAVAQVK